MLTQKKVILPVRKRPPLQEIEAQAQKEESIPKALDLLRKLLKDDPRSAAKRLVNKFEKKIAQDEKQNRRVEELLVYEKDGQARGFKSIAGVDEAGRGPLAGPVVAAAVIFPPDSSLNGLDDSKKLTENKREELFPKIHERAMSVGVGWASSVEIDQLNIYRAAQLAMERAIEALAVKPDYLLTDAMPLPRLSTIPQKPIIHGDALSASIAAASIIAKVTRDRHMMKLHEKYPAYGFENHKGYGTAEHLEALKEQGICLEHRLTFAPVMETLSQKAPGGPYGFWSQKLQLAESFSELQKVGLQIKRAALPYLSAEELERLRELFRGKREQWERKP